MRLTGDAATDVATFVAFDPIEVADLLGEPNHKPKRWDEAVDECRMAMYLAGGDGSVNFTVYIDEQPPEIITQRKKYAGQGYLKITSGTLCLTGAEDLSNNENLSDAGTFKPDMGHSFKVPPGDYHVEGFEVGWDEDEIEQLIATEYLDPEQQKVLDAAPNWCGVSCLLFLLSILSLAVLAAVSYVSDVWLWLWIGVVVVVGSWFVTYLIARLNPNRESILVARKEFYALCEKHESEYPELVLVLTPNKDRENDTEIQGCRFGINA